MKEVDKSIIQFLNILRKYSIELVCFSGTAVNIYRDNHFKYDRRNWNNFFLDYDLYIDKLLNLKNTQNSGKKIEIKKEIEDELKKINWYLIKVKVNPVTVIVSKKHGIKARKPILRFKNYNSSAKIELYCYLSYEEKKYYGLTDFCFIDKRFFSNPQKIYINDFYIFVPKFIELYLKSIYGNWKEKNRRAKRKNVDIYLSENCEDITTEPLTFERIKKYIHLQDTMFSKFL